MWERFNFYGMRAILTLFIVSALMMSKEESSIIYGGFLGLCYLTPMLGGFISDRFLGNRNCIMLGGSLMAVGQLLLFSSASIFDSNLELARTLRLPMALKYWVEGVVIGYEEREAGVLDCFSSCTGTGFWAENVCSPSAKIWRRFIISLRSLFLGSIPFTAFSSGRVGFSWRSFSMVTFFMEPGYGEWL